MLEEFYLTTIDNNKYLLPLCHKGYHDNRGLFEKELIEFCKEYFKDNKNGIFLDVGAHTGTYSINLSPYFKEVYSYEPQRATFYALCGAVALNNLKNVYPRNYALGSIEQFKNNGNNYLNIISPDGGGSTLQNTTNIIKKELIEVNPLDAINTSFRDIIKFIKLDIEGNELEFLKGAFRTIIFDRPIILMEQNDNEDALTFLQNELKYDIKKTVQNNMFLCTPKILVHLLND